MKAWLSRLNADLSFVPGTPEELALYDLSRALPDVSFKTEIVQDLGEGYAIHRNADGSYCISGGPAGILYGAYAFIRLALSGEALPSSLSSSPRYSLRMLNCWDNADGSVERGYSGRSVQRGD